jgi:hypothetical protein
MARENLKYFRDAWGGMENGKWQMVNMWMVRIALTSKNGTKVEQK